MATRSIVPRADGEGSLGTQEKQWGDVQAKKLNGENVTTITEIAKLIKITAHFERSYTPIAAKGVSTGTRNVLVVPAMTVNIDGVVYILANGLELDADATDGWDSAAYAVKANRAGKDFYIYACAPESGTTPDFILSANSTVPTGYTAASSRKIGGFHCECVAVGTIANHPLSGWAAGDILPASVWDLKHRPVGESEGYAYDEGTDMWYSVYGLTWTGSFGSAVATMAGRAADDTLKLESKYGAEWADGTSSEKWHCWKFEQILARQKQRLLYHREFVAASLGSNQGTNIYGSEDPVTTGGHKDTSNRRMISNIGLEDCCGDHWQWGADVGRTEGETNWVDAFDGNDKYATGQMLFGEVKRVRLGGAWDHGAVCGSRCSAWDPGALTLSAHCGARGASEPLYKRAI